MYHRDSFCHHPVSSDALGHYRMEKILKQNQSEDCHRIRSSDIYQLQRISIHFPKPARPSRMDLAFLCLLISVVVFFRGVIQLQKLFRQSYFREKEQKLLKQHLEDFEKQQNDSLAAPQTESRHVRTYAGRLIPHSGRKNGGGASLY